MFRSKIIISSIIFLILLIFTSIIKNQTRIVEKKLYKLNKKIALKEKDIIAKDMEHKPEDPYRNYAKEAIDILNRIHKKIDVLLEKQKEHLEEGHPRDDGKWMTYYSSGLYSWHLL